MPAHKRPRPWLAFVLNLLPFPGGLGYLYLAQRRKGLLSMLLLTAIQLLNLLGSFQEIWIIAALCYPTAFVFQLLTAEDALQVARERIAGRGNDPLRITVPTLAWLAGTQDRDAARGEPGQ